MLGRRQLQRWLQLLLFANQQTGAANPLLQLAATRGRLMELLADKLRGKSAELPEQAFMTGIMSLMPTLLNQRIGDILVQLPVAPAMAQALAAAREGQLAPCWRWRKPANPACAQIGAAAAGSTASTDDAQQRVVAGLAWANNIGRDAGELSR